ncbi:MAG: bifunctional alpha,alpha-trehalose-phosphate synthase (UDP-forming)/trehalose-phosphatase [Desulfobacterales bacterium]|nr:MAG: bifunctional alpha,alpha-trehalose-phosphate synthase (UDP-forming)/trehalose-phosphatase [Desulfobacterales bacterium]
MESLIIVSNRLPVTIGKTIEKSSGGLVYAMEGLGDQYAFSWVGWAGGVVDDPAEKSKISAELKERFNYIPIFLGREDAQDFYTGFSNSSLWPLLHYMSAYARYDERWWEAYQKVNRLFADTVLEMSEGGDTVWVHDYHLMLLPSILRQARPELKIGFFLHTPFPSYELFRCHPNREKLLEGLLGADLIGFHTYGYLRHFRSTIMRLLGLESDIDHVPQESHKTSIGVYPIGINSKKFLDTLQSDTYAACYRDYRQNYQGKKVVLSVERLDYSKGIPRRLDAIERYLNDTDQRDDIVFIFINIPSRESVEEYQKLLEELQGKVGYINGKYATINNIPVHFIHKSVNFSELCALYALADVAMVTPLIDGMNLVAKEYLACQQERNGVLILSEFAGAAQELPNALIVNPYNINEVAQAIKQALQLSEERKKKMVEPMKERVIKYDARYWAESFFRDLNVRADDKEPPAVTQVVSLEAIDPLTRASQLAFFLDYDGTLAEIKKRPEDALPDDDIKDLFARLEAKHSLDVYIISGRKKEDMDRWFSRYDFNLIAEHGYYYKHRNADDWIVFDTQADLWWKDRIIDVFQLYTGMTPGSSVEEKTSSVVWHYRNSDPEFGTWKANQLVAELYEMLSNLPVEIHHGQKIVEVGSIQLNKGMALRHFVQLNRYDAVLCAGDDETDESMFRLADDNPEILSIFVGDRKATTAAKFRASSPRAFRAFLTEVLQKL